MTFHVRQLGYLLRPASVGIVFLVLVLVACWSMIGMPGKSFSGPRPPLSPEHLALSKELAADVQKLGGAIGARNVYQYEELKAGADFIEQAFAATGLQPRRQSYE